MTSVSFEREERAVFKRAVLWRNLTGHERAAVITRLANRDPGGIALAALTDAQEVLSGIVTKAMGDRAMWLEASVNGPETAPEDSIVANPRQAAKVLVEARDRAIKDCTEALFLVETAMRFATPVFNEREEENAGL